MTDGRVEKPEGTVMTIPESDPQWERAHQSWSLHLDLDPTRLSHQERLTLFRTLRTKRTERAGLLGKLPGIVRRGARVDLESLEADLQAAGFDCELRRSETS
jgi:hypothetical protein